MSSDLKWRQDLFRIIACVARCHANSGLTEWPKLHEIATETGLSQKRIMDIVNAESCLSENVALATAGGFANLAKRDWTIEFDPWG